jgi:hypothetical protein
MTVMKFVTWMKHHVTQRQPNSNQSHVVGEDRKLVRNGTSPSYLLKTPSESSVGGQTTLFSELAFVQLSVWAMGSD